MKIINNRKLILAGLGVLFSTSAISTTFDLPLSTGTVFTVTSTDAPLTTGTYGIQNYLNSEPDCPIVLGDHSYAVQTFTTGTAGLHTLETLSPSSNVDTFIALYSPSFDPNNPTQNLITCDDDGGSAWPLSRITANLTAGTTYTTLVTTWDALPVNGTINWQITPDITLVDAPVIQPRAVPAIGLWGLALLSMFLFGIARRRLK